MSGALSPVAGRSRGAEDLNDRMIEAQHARLAEIRASVADRATSTVDRPAAAARAETARPVETMARAGATGPALTAEVRSMLLTDSAPATGPSHSTRLIGQLLDALRSYQDRPN